MEEKKPGFFELLGEKFASGNQGPPPEIPKKFCSYCELETATWAFCDQCGKLFWGRIVWDVACGAVCIWLGLAVLLKSGAEFYEKVIAVLVGAAGLWVLTRIIRQLGKAYLFWRPR
ncbi:MAG: hypothetical protein ACYDIC_19890 [Desulfobaccales bacterium]